MNFQIKHLGKEDVLLFEKMISLFHHVFEMDNREMPRRLYLQNLLGNEGFIAYAAVSDGEVAAGITAHVLPMYYTGDAEAFIYDVAVLPGYQRKGLGKMLLTALNEYCCQHHIKEVFVAAHEENKHALDFYRSAGGDAEKVVHFNFTTGK